MDKSGLSKEILDYYYGFGQNRNLERYFKLHKSCHKSSSEGSVNNSIELNRKNENRNEMNSIMRSKSLDNLTLHRNNKSDKDDLNADNLKQEQQTKVKNLSSSNDDGNQNQIKHSVSTMTHTSGITKKEKGISFSCESNISINLPLPISINNPISRSSQNHSIGVGTDNQNTEETDKLDQSNCSSNDNELLKSPSTKMEKRLEWDSLGDVGYNKSPRRRKRKNTITTLEKSILKEFFANQGIEINFPLYEKVEEEKEQEHEEKMTPKIIEFQSKSIIEKPPSKKTSVSREKWREVLDNVKRKYKSGSVESSGLNLNLNQNSFSRRVSDENHSTPKEKVLEKCIQTSFVIPSCPSENKEIQVDFTKKDLSNLSTTEGDSVVSPSSFEYVSKPNQIDYSANSDKENQAPESTKRRFDDEENRKHDKTSTSSTDLYSDATSDVNLGVKLLCSLIEAKSLNNKQKKLLAKRIIAKITKKKITSANERTTSSSCFLSGSSSASLISTSRQCAIKVDNINDEKKLKTRNSSSMGSDQSKSNQQENLSIVKKVTVEEQSRNRLPSSDSEKQLSSTSSSHKNGNRINRIQDGKLEIEKESVEEKSSSVPKSSGSSGREDLLKNWLGNVTKSEIDYAQRKIAGRDKIDFKAGGDGMINTERSQVIGEYLELERNNHIGWIENEIKHLENLKKLLLIQKPDENGSKISPLQPQVTITYPVHKNITPHIYDKAETSSKNYSRPNIVNSIATDKIIDIQQVKSETKIINPKEKYTRKVKRTTNEIFYDNVKAPVIGEADRNKQHLRITTYKVDEEKRFPKKDYKIDKIDKGTDRTKLKTPENSVESNRNLRFGSESAASAMAASNHYSELRDVAADSRKSSSVKGYSYTNSVPNSTDFSSSSVSLPVVQSSSTTTTTTHRYDRQAAVGIQTSDSLLRTVPIFGLQNNCECCNCKICNCKRTRSTVREYAPSNQNKQAQVKPTAVAYIINFEEKNKTKSQKSEDDDQILEYCQYTLQDYLHKKRPDFRERVAERQRILNEMKALRKLRQEKIDEILENASESSISNKLNLLPPPPTKYIRIFGTKEMKAMTKRNCKQLPEVVAKAERETKERKKRNTRVLSNVFNKRLQRRVHTGKLSLEHSRTVI